MALTTLEAVPLLAVVGETSALVRIFNCPVIVCVIYVSCVDAVCNSLW